jgi:hypothetical protein
MRHVNPLWPIDLSCPFTIWGINIGDVLPRAPRGFRFLFIAIDTFSKWMEALPVVNIRQENQRNEVVKEDQLPFRSASISFRLYIYWRTCWVECLASVFEYIVNHVPPTGGGAGTVATDDIVCSPASWCLASFDDPLLEEFLQIVIRSVYSWVQTTRRELPIT